MYKYILHFFRYYNNLVKVFFKSKRKFYMSISKNIYQRLNFLCRLFFTKQVYLYFIMFLMLQNTIIAKNFLDCSTEELFSELSQNTWYQDIFINDKIYSQNSVCQCNNRYKIVKKICDQFTRPFTVLDLGAAQGYFSFRIAKDYDATCVMIQTGNNNIRSCGSTADLLHRLCQLNNEISGTILLKKHIDIQTLQELSEVEHFDLILAFNIIHHLPENKKTILDILRKLGTHVLIEIPQSCPVIHYARTLNPMSIDYLSRRRTKNLPTEMFWFQNTEKSYLSKCNWNQPMQSYIITSNSSKTQYIHNHFENYPMGIHFSTFQALNGVFPSLETIYHKIDNEKQKGTKITPDTEIFLQKDTIFIKNKNTSQ